MNILLLRNYNPYIESSASANRFRGLVDGLCREGHHVTIGVTGGYLKQSEKSFQHNLNNLTVVYLSTANHYQGLIGRLNTYFFDSLHIVGIRSRLKKLTTRHYDIVWLTNNGVVLRLFEKCFGDFTGKTFMELNEFNDISIFEETSSSFLQKRKARRNNCLFLDTVGKIDLFAVMTKKLTTYYQSMAKPDARFIHLPMTVDLYRFDHVPKENEVYQKPYIAFTGTMNNKKDGVDVLIKAFAQIANKYPSYHLYLAGFWYYDVPMQEKLIEEFGLKGRIHHIGTLNRDQIPSFVCNASLLTLSRPDSHQAQGGFPTKLGEYLATSKPVCVTKVGEIADYLKDNVSAFMAEPGDVDSFAKAMDCALSDEVNANRVGANGRKVAEECFDVVVQVKRLATFLKENLLNP